MLVSLVKAAKKLFMLASAKQMRWAFATQQPWAYDAAHYTKKRLGKKRWSKFLRAKKKLKGGARSLLAKRVGKAKVRAAAKRSRKC